MKGSHTCDRRHRNGRRVFDSTRKEKDSVCGGHVAQSRSTRYKHTTNVCMYASAGTRKCCDLCSAAKTPAYCRHWRRQECLVASAATAEKVGENIAAQKLFFDLGKQISDPQQLRSSYSSSARESGRMAVSWVARAALPCLFLTYVVGTALDTVLWVRLSHKVTTTPAPSRQRRCRRLTVTPMPR